MKPNRLGQRSARRVPRRTAVARVLRRALRLQAFAAQLAKRHTRAARRVSSPDLLLARSTTTIVTNLSQRYVLNLPLLERRSHERTQITGSVIQTLERVMPIGGRSPDTVAVPRMGTASAMVRELTLRHLVVERARRESLPTVRTSQAVPSRIDADLPTSPSSLTVARAAQQFAGLTLAKPSPIAAPAVPAGMATTDAVEKSASHRGGTAVTAVTERDIERLTERVIGSIDRRLVAQRERFGRP